MLQNYLKTTARHLWRQSLFTTLNVIGLAIGISSCWLIYRVTSYELSFDSKHPHKDNIVKVITNVSRPEEVTRYGAAAAPLYQGIRSEVTGVKEVVPAFKQWLNRSESQPMADGKAVHLDDPQDVVAIDDAYFRMLPYTWLAGTQKTAFASPNNVVLTESRAKIYFPGAQLAEIVNQTITYLGNDTVERTVSGIVADYYTPSEFTGKEFIQLENKAYPTVAWTNTNGSDKLYLQLLPGADPASVLAQVNRLSARQMEKFATERNSPLISNKTYEFLSLADVHFSTDIQDYGVSKTNKKVVYGLIAVGFFLLALACINYINMSVAQIPQRSKEIGVRKTLGSSNTRLIIQFLAETFATIVIALFIAFFLGQLLFHLLKDVVPAEVTFMGAYSELAVFLLCSVFIVTLLAGIYPGWLSSRVKTILVIKNSKITFAGRGLSLQKTLIVFQFVIAQFFIVSAIIVGTQLRHLVKSDMGFNKEAIILLNVPWNLLDDPQYANKQFALLEELRYLSGIANIAMGKEPLSAGYSAGPYEYSKTEGQEPATLMLHKKTIDDKYLGLYRINLLAGHNLRATDTITGYLINETAARAMGYHTPQEAIGKMMGQPTDTKFPVVGVVKDFHTQNFYAPIPPLAMMSYKENLNNFNIKLDGHDPSKWQATLAATQRAWNKFYPAAAFEYHFYDDTLEQLYAQERRLSTLINLATAITIVISCLGLFGLSTLMAFQRTKEIGIRKVLGSSVMGIVKLLSSDFIVLVAIAIAIGSPLAWWAVQDWLHDFVYRISISWWMFASAACGAIAIALATVSYQALRAARANPVSSLREE